MAARFFAATADSPTPARSRLKHEISDTCCLDHCFAHDFKTLLTLRRLGAFEWRRRFSCVKNRDHSYLAVVSKRCTRRFQFYVPITPRKRLVVAIERQDGRGRSRHTRRLRLAGSVRHEASGVRLSLERWPFGVCATAVYSLNQHLNVTHEPANVGDAVAREHSRPLVLERSDKQRGIVEFDMSVVGVRIAV